MLDKIRFEINTPVAITLKHASGKIVSGHFGEQVYYSLEGGRCCYLDLDVAQKVNMLEPQAGETIMICKRNSKIWDVWLSPETEKFRAMSEPAGMEQELRASVAHVNEKRYNTLTIPLPPAANGGSNGNGARPPAPAPLPQPSLRQLTPNNGNSTPVPLADEAALLVDAFAKVLEYSLTTYGGRVKPDDVRSLLLTVYIGRQKHA